MRNSKPHLFTLALVGFLWLFLILGCTQIKEISNSGQTASPTVSPTSTATTSPTPSTATNNSLTNSASTTGVTLANFNRLQTGMTYAQVVQILGKEGEESGVLGSGPDKVVMYKWDADDDGSGARLDAFFKSGKLDKKLQFALK